MAVVFFSAVNAAEFTDAEIAKIQAYVISLENLTNSLTAWNTVLGNNNERLRLALEKDAKLARKKRIKYVFIGMGVGAGIATALYTSALIAVYQRLK
jgi:hypothetical protein